MDSSNNQHQFNRTLSSEAAKKRDQRHSRAALLGLIGVPLFVFALSYFLTDRQERIRAQTPVSTAGGNRVVLYCSVDEVYAKPIIARIEKQTGLQIDALYDVEAAKTAGLANKLRAEKARPRADVFLSGAVIQSIALTRAGVIQPYTSDATRDVPKAFRAEGGAWTGIGVRARVIVYHKSLANPPRDLDDLLNPELRGKVGIANPAFGTSSDWVSALSQRKGLPTIVEYFEKLRANGAQVLPGNSVVAERVARGELLAGVTDTDDYLAMRREVGDAIGLAPPGPLFPTIARRNLVSETVLVPTCVSLIRGGPHPEAGARLMEALLSRETELQLAKVQPGVMPTRGPLPIEAAELKDYGALLRDAPVDYGKWIDDFQDLQEPLRRALG